jgi:tetratricopeptide (TPR) repeat protein
MPRFVLALLLLGAGLLALPAAARAADGAAAAGDSLAGFADISRHGRLALFKAEQLRAAGDKEGAARSLTAWTAANADSDHYLIEFELGTLLAGLEQPEAARQAFRRASALEPRHAESWLNRGELAYQAGDYDEAAAAIHQGYLLTPGQPAYLLYAAAAARILAGHQAEALPLLEELVYTRSELAKLDWYRALIAACLETGAKESGRRAVEHMLGHHRTQPDAWQLAYQYHVGAAAYREAAVALTVMGYLRPLSEGEQVQLGNLYTAAGLPALAGDCYAAALGDSAGPADFERLAAAYLAAHAPQAALATLERALAAQPSPRLWSLLGDLRYLDAAYGEALAAYSRCVELDPQAGRALLMQGYCALELGRGQEAAALLQQAAGFPEQSEAAGRLLARLRSKTP